MKFSAEQIEKIRRFILVNVERCPNNISEVTQSHFNLSKQTAFKYISQLEKENLIKKTSKGRYPNYLIVSKNFNFEYGNIKSLSEETILINDIAPLTADLSENVQRSFDYTVSEMVNNVIDHSDAKKLKIKVEKNSVWTQISIIDDGIGIFTKIQNTLNLQNPKDAIIELAKGKFTSDEVHHSGEGIFFTSKICDDFAVTSKSILFKGDKLGTMLSEGSEEKLNIDGTAVFLRMYNDSKTDPADIFDEYQDSETFAFNKTKIPVKAMETSGVILVSRSQAKRLLSRLEKFSEVILDFQDVSEIGQGFSDEIFRVFKNEHPSVTLIPINCCERVKKMILHARGGEDFQ